MKESSIHYNQIFNYDRVINVVEKTMSTSSFYWQSLSIVVCFAVAYLLYKHSFNLLTRKLEKTLSKKNPHLAGIIKRYALPNLYPVLALLLLCQAYLIYSQFWREAIIFLTTIKLISLFLFLSFLRISSGSHFVANMAGLLLVPTLVLDIFGALDLAIEFLDQFAFKIGAIRISVYLILKASAVTLIVIWFSNLVSRKSKNYIEHHSRIRSSTKTILGKFIDVIVYATIIIVVLNLFGVDMKTFAFIGGAVGVGVGLGLQKIASNFISGIILLFEKSVEIGDIVELDNGGIYGTIKQFNSRYTLIEAIDGKEILVPNEEIIINKVANWTHSNKHARIEIKVGIAYNSDVKKAQQILIEAAKSHPRCLHSPSVECYIDTFGDYDVKLLLYFWIGNIVDGRGQTRGEVMEKILEKLRENNIEIPYPQREVRITPQQF